MRIAIVAAGLLGAVTFGASAQAQTAPAAEAPAAPAAEAAARAQLLTNLTTELVKKHGEPARYADVRNRRSRDDDRKHPADTDGAGNGGLPQLFPRLVGARFAALISG